MGGTRIGGIKTREKNLSKDKDFYRNIGKAGGTKSRGGGFADGEAGRERARKYGAVGGRNGKRGKSKLSDFKIHYESHEPSLKDKLKTVLKNLL